MKISQYTFVEKDSYPPVLFNALSQYEVTVDYELFDALKGRAFRKLDDQTKEELLEIGVLVPYDSDEEKTLTEYLENETSRNEELDVTYALTFNCNMKCDYCVQSDTEGENECDDDTFTGWLSNHIDATSPKSLHLTFFGGEPLLKADSIFCIAEKIHNKCSEAGVKLSLCVTTNGTLIEAGDIRQWKLMGLESLDITIDGTREMHDRRRVYKNGGGTFEDIVKNLAHIDGNVAVNLICNINRSASDYNDFLRFLKTKRLKYNSIRFKPIFDGLGSDVCFHDSVHIVTLKKVWKEAEELSIPVDRSFIIGPCGFFKKNSLVVSPSGELYPCTPFFGWKDFLMGNIAGNEALVKKHALLNNLPQQCKECSYCPICCGGCRFVSMRLQGDISKVTCEKQFFDSIFVSL